jgi:hypothetical protein
MAYKEAILQAPLQAIDITSKNFGRGGVLRGESAGTEEVHCSRTPKKPNEIKERGNQEQ